MPKDQPAAADKRTPVKQPPRPKLAEILGPGLVTGASDDDPSGIATYAQAGAQFGYATGWTMLLTYPLMSAIQLISAEIGRVTGNGLAMNFRRHYPATIVYILLGFLCIANAINIGADLGAMGAAVELLIGGPPILYAAIFAILSVTLEIFMRYARYVKALKWLTLSLFAYVATVFAAGASWHEMLTGLFWPKITFTHEYLTTIVAILGTTISPFLFFWQADSEVEDIREKPEAKPLSEADDQAPREMSRMRADTFIGMALSNIIALFIIWTAAATLHAHGQTDIQTSADAAKALEPAAGKFAYIIFSLGIIGTGLLALPVLAGSTAYAIGEVAGFPTGLAKPPADAKRFYAIIAVITAIGLLLNIIHIDPIKALFWSAVINGVAAVPIMAMMMLLANRTDVMGKYRLHPLLRRLGWLATIIIALAALSMMLT